MEPVLKSISSKHRDPSEYGKVGVLMGGDSAEREISLVTGQATLEALKEAGVDAHAVDVQRDTLLNTLMQQNFDLVFIALHGRGGEDGEIQGILDFLNIPYTGSGREASTIAMNKHLTKQIWHQEGLPALPGTRLRDGFVPEEVIAEFGLPLAVKAAHEGSTFGITRVNHIDELMPAYLASREFGDCVIIEPWVEGDEYTVGIVGKDILPPILIKPANKFYDFHAKYNANDTQYIIRGDISEDEEAVLSDLSLRAYEALGCHGWGRVDFIRDAQRNFWLLEVNTIPGLTDHSLIPKEVKHLGYTFIDLVLAIMDEALLRKSTLSDSHKRLIKHA